MCNTGKGGLLGVKSSEPVCLCTNNYGEQVKDCGDYK